METNDLMEIFPWSGSPGEVFDTRTRLHVPSPEEIAQSQRLIHERMQFLRQLESDNYLIQQGIERQLQEMDHEQALAQQELNKILNVMKLRIFPIREALDLNMRCQQWICSTYAAVAHEVEAEQAFLASIKKLPAEMLSEIFHHFALAGGSVKVLLLVSRSWNLTARKTHSLWTHISIGRSSPGSDIDVGPNPELGSLAKYCYALELAEPLLAHTTVSSLDLRLSPFSYIPKDADILLIELAKKHAHRLRSLSIFLTAEMGLELHHFEYPDVRMERLEYLALSTRFLFELDGFLKFINMVARTATKLRHLSTTMPFDSVVLSKSVAWKSMTHLHVEKTVISLEHLVMCTNLVELSMRAQPAETILSTESYQFPYLRSLKLCDSTVLFLVVLQVPELQRLELSNVDDYAPILSASLSFPNIKELAVRDKFTPLRVLRRSFLLDVLTIECTYLDQRNSDAPLKNYDYIVNPKRLIIVTNASDKPVLSLIRKMPGIERLDIILSSSRSAETGKIILVGLGKPWRGKVSFPALHSVSVTYHAWVRYKLWKDLPHWLNGLVKARKSLGVPLRSARYLTTEPYSGELVPENEAYTGPSLLLPL